LCQHSRKRNINKSLEMTALQAIIMRNSLVKVLFSDAKNKNKTLSRNSVEIPQLVFSPPPV